MKIATIGQYEIHQPTSGGKAGKGNNITSSIQVRLDSTIVKTIKYSVHRPGGKAGAIAKAKMFIHTEMFTL